MICQFMVKLTTVWQGQGLLSLYGIALGKTTSAHHPLRPSLRCPFLSLLKLSCSSCLSSIPNPERGALVQLPCQEWRHLERHVCSPLAATHWNNGPWGTGIPQKSYDRRRKSWSFKPARERTCLLGKKKSCSSDLSDHLAQTIMGQW